MRSSKVGCVRRWEGIAWILPESQLRVADCEDAFAEFVELVAIQGRDGMQFGQSAGVFENDVAQGRGAEDEELRKSEFLGFGFAPFAETLIELLLLGGEI